MKSLVTKKLNYTITEVSKITSIEQYVLRYWEKEFKQLHPLKNRVGRRVYTNHEVRFILEIKKLLYEERYTIEGAKKKLSNINTLDTQFDLVDEIKKTEDEKLKKTLKEVREFLLKLVDKLDKIS